MKTIAAQYFDQLIKDCFQSVLKPLGFKKKANNFYRPLEELGQIINIQKSIYYSKEHIKFTINTGLFIPEYWLTYYNYHDGKIPDFPVEHVCAIRQRIGELKYKTDTWFDINEATDMAELKKETTDNVLNYIVPYFERVKNREGVLKLLQEQDLLVETFVRLIIFGEYKEKELAQREFEKLKHDKYIRRNMRSELVEYRDKYGLVDRDDSIQNQV